MVATEHPLEVMTATYHPSLAGDVAGHSSNTQWSFQQCSSTERNAFVLCWFWRPTRVRTHKCKLSASQRHLSTSLRTRWTTSINLVLMKRRDLNSVLLPTKLWRKSPFEVAESVIGRPQNTSLWTGSEAECRDAVCVGVLLAALLRQ